MNISIRKFLLVNLLIAVTITTSITVIGNYYLDQKDIQEHLDVLLVQTTLMLKALVVSPNRDFQQEKKNLEILPFESKQLLESRVKNTYLEKIIHSMQFQILDNKRRVLLKSRDAPPYPMSKKLETGFSNMQLDHHQWRTYTLRKPNMGLNIIVAERYDIRNQLSKQIALDDFYIMLWTYPFSGFLIWIIIGHGLDSLKRVARAVSRRDPNNLTPVNHTMVPIEILPLVEELNKLFERLNHTLLREKRFSSDAAHELRTPLAALRMHAQVAFGEKDREKQGEQLKKLIVCVDRATHVVQQLLTLSRMVPEQAATDSSRMNLVQVACEVIADEVPVAIEKNIDLCFECEEEEVLIMANPTAIGILLRNLIDNAIRYSPAHSSVQIHVTIESARQEVVLHVTDSGPGIPDTLKERVFERFFRIFGTQTTGSGLGLAIVAQISQIYSAKLKLKTPDSGIGLCVEVTFRHTTHADSTDISAYNVTPPSSHDIPAKAGIPPRSKPTSS